MQVESSSLEMLPPRGFGAVPRVSRQCCHDLTALLTGIPKSSAASRQDTLDATLRSRASANPQNRISSVPHPSKENQCPQTPHPCRIVNLFDSNPPENAVA
jgi:hypothetical protein